MFSHIMLGADDVQQAREFYDATLGALGHQPGTMDDKGRCFYFSSGGVFAIISAISMIAAVPVALSTAPL